MAETSIPGLSQSSSIVLHNGKAALPLKAGQTNVFKAKAGEHYRNLKKKDAEEQLLDNVVAKPTGEDGKPLDAEGTGLTLQSAFIQAPVEGNDAATEAALEAAMPEQLAQGLPPSAQGAEGASLNEGNNLGGQVFAYAGADALLLAQAETGITADVVASGAADPAVAAAGIGPLGILGIVGLGVGVAAAVGGSSKDTLAPTLSITSNVAAVKTGETATITFTFSEAPTGFVDGDITTTGGTLGSISGSGLTRTATFTPTAGLASGNASITVASASYTDAAGNSGGAGTTPTISIDTTAPTVASVAISSATNSQNSTLNAGDVVSVTVTMSEATTVVTSGGTPQLALVIGATTVQAAYASGSGGTALVFTYTVLAGQTDANGISIAANSLALNGGTLSDAAGNAATLTHALVADNAGYLVDTTAPTVTNTSGAYTSSTDTLVLTGTNYNTLLDAGETAATDIKARLDWTKLSWDINGDNATTTDVSFVVGDISSAKVTDSTHLTIVLASAKGTSLEATSGYGGTTLDTLDVTAGFAKDAAGNAATTDARADGVLTAAGQSVIDLGSYGKLIAPVQVEGAWYYYWDIGQRSQQWLDGIFTTTQITLNGVRVALPTANGGADPPQGVNKYQNGTSYEDAGVSTNGTTGTLDGLLAIWDAYNGTGNGTGMNGTPPGWPSDYYWVDDVRWGHDAVDLSDGQSDAYTILDGFSYYIALQVM